MGIAFFASAGVAEAQGFERYLSIKKIGTQLALRNKILVNDQGSNLHICDTWSVIMGTSRFSSRQDARLLDVAGAVVKWRRDLASVTRKELWLPELVRAEERMVATALNNRDPDIDAEGKRLVRAVNQKLGRKKLEWMSECGAGGPVDVTFKTEPEIGRVRIISEFSYELCKLVGTQNDPDKCTSWRVAKDREAVSGVYYIRIEGPGRIVGPDRYDLSSGSNKIDDKQIVRLRFP